MLSPRSILRHYGFDVVRYADAPQHPFPVLPLVVEARLAADPDFSFVQIGANDGVRNDPIHDLVVRHRLRGLFVEPLPDLFATLCKNYAGLPGLAFANVAVGETEGVETLYRVRPAEGIPDWVQGIASFNRQHLLKFGVPDLARHIEPTTVEVVTLPTLLARYDLRAPTLLQVDTEGWDARIVTAALRGGLRPYVINFESNHVTPRERAGVKHLLVECGYGFVDVGRDTLAVRLL